MILFQMIVQTKSRIGRRRNKVKFTPDIKFVNDETLNEFVVTVER